MIQLSIITVNLNNVKGLIKTILSIKSQDYTDFEYIIIDGHSEDGSIEVIKEFDQHITFWISEPDDGIYQAMNKGIRQANGKYLLFLNSGDYLVNKDCLKDVFSKPHKADLLLCKCNISDNGKVVHTTNPPQKLTFGYLYNTGLAHQSILIKNELFSKFGYYREDFRYNADIEFWYRTVVFNHCSTETLGVILSEYNLEGISAKENKSDIYQREMNEINSHPLLQLLIADYDTWNAEKREMKVLYWAKSKRPIYKAIKVIYMIACWHQRCKLKVRNFNS